MEGIPKAPQCVGTSVRLEVGDRLPPTSWCDRAGKRLSLSEDRFCGRTTILFLCPPPLDSPAQDRIKRLIGRQEVFRQLGIQSFIVVGEPAPPSETFPDELGPDAPVICDTSGTLTEAVLGPEAPQSRSAWPVVILDECQRVERVIRCPDSVAQADQALAHCATRKAAEARGPRHPPVLVLPNLITPDHCQALIAAWESGNRYQGGVASASSGHEVRSAIKVREDLALADLGAEAQALFAVFRRRLFPEVARIFHYEISRAETLRLGCYDSTAGGTFKAHRDNSTPAVRHRAFALSLFLNSGAYRGGRLRFPEYSLDGYNPPAGSAVVFSCSLLHEVTPVTEGRRFGLFGFFHGEAEEALRRAAGAPYEYLRVDGRRPTSPLRR